MSNNQNSGCHPVPTQSLFSHVLAGGQITLEGSHPLPTDQFTPLSTRTIQELTAGQMDGIRRLCGITYQQLRDAGAYYNPRTKEVLHNYRTQKALIDLLIARYLTPDIPGARRLIMPPEYVDGVCSLCCVGADELRSQGAAYQEGDRDKILYPEPDGMPTVAALLRVLKKRYLDPRL